MVTQVSGKKVILRGRLAYDASNAEIASYIRTAEAKLHGIIQFETVYMFVNPDNSVHVEVFDKSGKPYTVVN